ncbi:MAG: polysaccharide biosynthesis/export family protein [Syntrophaceae bacterium]|nr:polysaccharide biosynthesis/export family protein [Syntrophaceae bacterium]
MVESLRKREERAYRSMGFMKSMFLAAGFILTFPAALFAGEPEGAKPVEAEGRLQSPAYVVSCGDVLEISVWKEEALTKTVTVLPDGRISFPLVGEVQAAGKTIKEIKDHLKQELSPYANEPILSVEVRQAGSMQVYVIGKVNSPGRFALNGRINVLQALAAAGGLNPFAKRNRIKIFRGDGESTHIYSFRYDEVIEGANVDQNIWLQRGDVVVVP